MTSTIEFGKSQQGRNTASVMLCDLCLAVSHAGVLTACTYAEPFVALVVPVVDQADWAADHDPLGEGSSPQKLVPAP